MYKEALAAAWGHASGSWWQRREGLNRVSVRVGGFYSGETDKPAAGAKAGPGRCCRCRWPPAHHRESLPSVQWRWTVQCWCSQLGGAASPLGLGAWACERSMCPRSKREEQQCGGICRAIRLLGPGVGVGAPAACSGRATTHGGLGTVSDSTTGACLIPSLSPSFVLSSKQGHLSVGRR